MLLPQGYEQWCDVARFGCAKGFDLITEQLTHVSEHSASRMHVQLSRVY